MKYYIADESQTISDNTFQWASELKEIRFEEVKI